MIPRKACCLWLLLYLSILVHFAASNPLSPHRRQEIDPEFSPSPSPTQSDERESSAASTDRPTSGSATGSDSPTRSSTFTPVSTNEAGAVDADDGRNVTIAPGELPLKPEITPGWAVSGVLLLCTGAIYTLVGIRNTWLHTFFSTAYLASLGTTVLIIYVMEPPIPIAIQGAYVVAVALTGAVLGGVTVFFKEVTEGLGCMLGGFCLSMWLLCLRPGGLLTATSAKIAFIASFTLGIFGLYFSRYTRDYALIGTIAFSGATVTVLGIDCFSRAGLREFWAYIWDLNENLFPLGVSTYPLTRGIEVEIAAIVVIFVAGIISQMKLWTIIQQRRAQREAGRVETQRQLEQEEENVGRQIEEHNARERRQWERTYGEGDSQSALGSSDSGLNADGDPEKAHKASDAGHSSRPQSGDQSGDAPTKEEAQGSGDPAPAPDPREPAPQGLMVSPEAQDGAVTVRVARDDTVPAPPRDDGGVVCTEEGPQHDKVAVLTASHAGAASPPPQVVPLPFRVPDPAEGEEVGRARDDGRSSVATYAAEDEMQSVGAGACGSTRRSLAKRLSQSSINLLRRVSHRTSPSTQLDGHSQEELVIPKAPRGDDDGSVAATVDMESVCDDGRRSNAAIPRQSTEISADMARRDSIQQSDATPQPATETIAKHISTVETVGTDILDLSEPMEPAGPSEATKADAKEASARETKRDSATTGTGTATATAPDGTTPMEGAPSQKAKSVLSVDSAPGSLTKDRLPQALSRVALSYRTNEWAKHLSTADTPEPDALQLSEYQPEVSAAAVKAADKEAAAPLVVEELQQTAATGTPAPAQPSTNSAKNKRLSLASSVHSAQATSTPPPVRGSVDLSAPSQPEQHVHQPTQVHRPSSTTGFRSSSANIHINPITEENAGIPSSLEHSTSFNPYADPTRATPVANMSGERPPVPGVVSYSSPQTLLGQREMFIRNKSQPSLLPASMSMPLNMYPTTTRVPSEAGSMYNYPMQPSQPLQPLPVPANDDDDMPMSQRRELMRQNSLLRTSASFSSHPGGTNLAYPHPAAMSVEALPFDSHQPQRYSNLPSRAARESQLAAFRQSVQMDIRSGTPVVQAVQHMSRETPFLGGGFATSGLSRESEVQRTINERRSMMLNQKEAEAQKRESEMWEKERGDRVFAERMQSGDLLEAHRDMMRRMQSTANIKES